MQRNIFITFDHVDNLQVSGFKFIKDSSHHPLDFRDHSLKEPVTDRYGTPIIYSPSDSRSEPVRKEIKSKFDNCSKLVVLIGSKTYLSEWVEWEINTFYDIKYELSGEKTWKRLRGMKLKGQEYANVPDALGGKSTKVMNWDPTELDSWLGLDPDR